MAVTVRDVSVTYKTSYEKVPTIKTALSRLGKGEKHVKIVEAVKGVSFDVPFGTTLGIVGSNGAGKSTLMRTVAGILPPNEGRIDVYGRVSTLLALGVGFNANLSGRENVILGGLAAGLTPAQVEARYREISEFAGIEDFMDLPMRTYSSGMFSRLAFSVAVHMDPDILLIDEALSAGDAKFRVKAQAKMAEIMKSARAMFLVSHALGSIVDMCNDCIWMHQGRIMLRGDPETVVNAYTDFLQVGRSPITQEEI